MNTKKIIYFLLLILFGSCNVIDQEPIDSISNEQLFLKRSDAVGAIMGAYNAMLKTGVNYVLMPELPTKNVIGNALNRQFEQINNKQFFDDNGYYNQLWSQNYLLINRVNVIINRVPDIQDAAFNNTEKAGILAEAHMLRAFAYFNLVRYFGKVPLIVEPTASPDLQSLKVSRDDVNTVYTQIFADLAVALKDLPMAYTSAIETKGRVTRMAAQALAVRIYLFTGKYTEVIAAANDVIATKKPLNSNTYASLFEAKNAEESIWELQFDNQNANGLANIFLPGSLGGVRQLQVNPDILSAYEEGDLRKAATFGFADKEEYVKKYTRRAAGDDNIIIFRLAEVLLSKAEAEAEMSYPSPIALDLLNQVRSRAGLKPLTLVDVPTIAAFRTRIYNDRRLELVYEGHSWFDLVRTDRIGEVLGITDINKKIWPIPSVEILRNENLLPQNPGY